MRVGQITKKEHSALRQAQGEPGEVKSEYSAGGCVYRCDNGPIKWLLGKHSGYHKWVLPKGLIEAGETAMETAVREVKEEMGVEARVIGSGPIETIEYTYMAVPTNKDLDLRFKNEDLSIKPERRSQTYQENTDFEKARGKVRVNKRVDFFLMEWVVGDPKDHDWEMEEARWFEFEEAIQKLDFEGERVALQKAQQIISSEV